MRKQSIVSRRQAEQPPASKLYICGTGVRVPGHLTVETMGILQSCSRIFTMLPPLVQELLPSPLAIRVEALTTVAHTELLDLPARGVMVDRILSAAGDQSPVAYLSHGNPAVGDPLLRTLIDTAHGRGIAVDLRPAVSSIDAILADLELDLRSGIQIYDAATFMLGAIRPRADLPCLLMQPTPPPLRRDAAGVQRAHLILRELRCRLLQDYPIDHEIALVAPAPAIGARALLERVSLDELVDLAAIAGAGGAALYIPPYSGNAPQRPAPLDLTGECRRSTRKNDFQA
jgi:uncharacterized protein YabN with tetrapyrrole methylase and pyrophosphatase domain